MAALKLPVLTSSTTASSSKLRRSVSSASLARCLRAAGSSRKAIGVSGTPPSFVAADGRRIVAVGDLHGDLAKTKSALKMAGVLSSDGYSWDGGDSVLVQVGDILDRGEDEIAILSLLSSLNDQARSRGGAVFQVNGNHETMNVEGDFRYVDIGGFDECIDFLSYLDDEHRGDWHDAFLSWFLVSESRKVERGGGARRHAWSPWNIVKRQQGVMARSLLLRPGRPLACELARHPVVLRIDDWIFCHGGLLPHHVKYGVERINKEVSNWMGGLNDDGDPENIPFIATRGYDSVVWSRLYSRESNASTHQPWQVSDIAERTLSTLGAKGMVVGHTPQTNGVNWFSFCLFPPSSNPKLCQTNAFSRVIAANGTAESGALMLECQEEFLIQSLRFSKLWITRPGRCGAEWIAARWKEMHTDLAEQPRWK